MSSAMMFERGMMAGMMPGSSVSPMSGTTPTSNWCVVPRCEIKVEKCKDGMKMHCKCDDEVACATLQNLCKMLAGGMCSCCCTVNGMTMLQCNLVCGTCKVEYTKDGCCVSCTSGDPACCAMIQSCCEAIACCLKSGCCCYVSMNGTPVCCGSC